MPGCGGSGDAGFHFLLTMVRVPVLSIVLPDGDDILRNQITTS